MQLNADEIVSDPTGDLLNFQDEQLNGTVKTPSSDSDRLDYNGIDRSTTLNLQSVDQITNSLLDDTLVQGIGDRNLSKIIYSRPAEGGPETENRWSLPQPDIESFKLSARAINPFR